MSREDLMREESEALVLDPLPASPKFDIGNFFVKPAFAVEFGGGAALAAVGVELDFVFCLGMSFLYCLLRSFAHNFQVG